MKKLDEEMKRSDELLSQMIPKSVAEKVKSGLNPVETCEVKINVLQSLREFNNKDDLIPQDIIDTVNGDISDDDFT